MAEPVTNLTALWVQNSGIQLSWTAASDVTSGSVYEIYALKNSPITDFPINYTYVPFSSVKPNPTLPSGSGQYTLQTPVTTIIFPWSSVMSLGYSNQEPLAVTIQIVHVDSTGAESQPTTVTAYPPQSINTVKVPHFQNQMSFDSNYGNVIVNAQDSDIEISSSVGFLLGTVVGQRPASPKYGIEDLPLSQINAVDIQKAISTWEPRAKTTISVQYDNYNNATLNVKIQNNGGQQ